MNENYLTLIEMELQEAISGADPALTLLQAVQLVLHTLAQ